MTIENALEAHQNGELIKAKQLYLDVLSSTPEDFNALHMIGVVHHQLSENDVAIEYFNKAIATGMVDAGVFNNLGSAYISKQMFSQALEALQRAITIDNRFVLAYLNVGNVYKLMGQQNNAIDAYSRAIDIQPKFIKPYMNMASVYMTLKQNDKAEVLFSKALEIEPENQMSKHMLASLRGETTKQAPDEHVADLFDYYSSNFDEHLIKELGYDIPVKIGEKLREFVDENYLFGNALDLGCGTGLVGENIKSICKHMTGVDLSSQMIEKARLREIYASLHVSNVDDYLKTSDTFFDLIICADVFPYIGELDTTFTEINNHVSKGGYIIYSTEMADGYPYVLRDTGRYAHSEKYLNELADRCGWTTRYMETVNIRKHHGQWIQGSFRIYQA